ncbi:hypothetical protein [Gordoniibacillus kamchatkensis]|uniref:hypothetical protein n=1 Tax=Gordoniibacillus kamchatkensis TaxID=1590651 RepID=UPI001E4A43F5|nr:hypothetical protein [Paenibacillus sp. VKM B-2647]
MSCSSAADAPELGLAEVPAGLESWLEGAESADGTGVWAVAGAAVPFPLVEG